MTEEAIKRLKEADMLEWIYYVRLEDPSENCVPRKGPEDTTFTKAIRNALPTGAPVITWKLSGGSPLQSRRGSHGADILTSHSPPSSNSEAKVAQSCPTLCDPMDCTVRGIFQARILEWIAIPFSRGSSQPRN